MKGCDLEIPMDNGRNLIYPYENAYISFKMAELALLALFFQKHWRKAGLENTALIVEVIWGKVDYHIVSSRGFRKNAPTWEARQRKTSFWKHPKSQ